VGSGCQLDVMAILYGRPGKLPRQNQIDRTCIPIERRRARGETAVASLLASLKTKENGKRVRDPRKNVKVPIQLLIPNL
jgi:hypothetical protein